MVRSCIVVGLGSIGSRHAKLLRERGLEVAVVSRRGGDAFSDIPSALEATRPGLVVIATETSHHADTLGQLAALDYRGTVLVEKPLFEKPRRLPQNRFAALLVAYNLRGHPGLRHLHGLLGGERVLSAQIYCGQYLPDWRPGRDYAGTYSCWAALGGGALRDLSHEFDYANWLLGPWRRVAALGGKLSSLAGDSEDAFAVLAEFERCPVASLHVNYLDRETRRQIVVNTDAHTFSLDLVAGELRCDREVVERYDLDRDHTYIALHERVLGDAAGLCDGIEGQRVVAMIAAAERAARSRAWVAAADIEEDGR